MASSEPRWHREAVQEAYEARDWYAERSAWAARGFLLTLEAAVSSVLESPRRYPSAKFGCRQYVFPNQYPFTLVYRLNSDGTIEILAVANQSRKPLYWGRRA